MGKQTRPILCMTAVDVLLIRVGLGVWVVDVIKGRCISLTETAR